MSKKLFSLLCSILLTAFQVASAQVMGEVRDSKTQMPIEGASIFYKGKNVGVETDSLGTFIIKQDSTWTTLAVSAIGYESKNVKLKGIDIKNLRIVLNPNSKMLSEVTVKAKRRKYNRIGNPAVELMNKVIANKKSNDLNSLDFYSYKKYERMSMFVNDIKDTTLSENELKPLSFMRNHVERDKETGKFVLPLTVSETTKRILFRKSPKTEKTIIEAQSDRGINEFINTGELISTVLKDLFVDINIFDNECRLLQNRFKSPIADNATSFYRYYIQDTLMIENEQTIELGFLPNNQQDFGFSGLLYITNDSTYQVKKAIMNIPRNSDVNFVDNMVITQTFANLPSGEKIVESSNMNIELSIASFFTKLMVKHTAKNYDYSLNAILQEEFSKYKGEQYILPNAKKNDANYWAEARQVQLSESEEDIDDFLEDMRHQKGFNIFMVASKILIENFIETSSKTEANKFDIGPINTLYTFNHYDKSRFRLSGLTTANLMPHLFFEGYIAYGTKTKNFYGRGKATYSFNSPNYTPREYPKKNLSISYMNDIIDPRQKYLTTDKDNVFISLNASSVTQFTHTKETTLSYEHEWLTGLGLYSSLTHTRNKAVDQLFFQRLGTYSNSDGEYIPSQDKSYWENGMKMSELCFKLTYEPHPNYVNTKKTRHKVTPDIPTYYISHTLGIKGILGSQWNYNITEAGMSKRFWLSSWGHVDASVKAGIQWDKVPFPLLIHPASNQSYIALNGVFSLLNNYEFLNDRWASAMFYWDLNGKLFNRIPLLRRLKWRESVGLKMLWGTLSDKNNPATSNYTDKDLYFFPGHFDQSGKYISNTYVMNPKVPYYELSVGIHNILKLFRVDFVHRFNYNKHENINRWGFRFGMQTAF